jgi:hypothetical protein
MFFIECVFEPLAELCYPRSWKSYERRVTAHFDNALIRDTEAVQGYLADVGFRTREHPQYIRDLAPCDFFLFETINENFSGHHFDGLDDFFVAVESLLSALSDDFLQTVFQDRTRRLKICCENNGEYFK